MDYSALICSYVVAYVLYWLYLIFRRRDRDQLIGESTTYVCIKEFCVDFVCVFVVTTFIYFVFDHGTLRATVLPVIVTVSVVCGVYEVYHLREQLISFTRLVRGWI